MRLRTLLAALIIIGCGLGGLILWVGLRKPGAPHPSLRSVLIRDVPHEEQKPDFCGEACAAMWLHKLGKPVEQDFVFDQSGVDPVLGRGAHASELSAALLRLGFRTGRGWYQVQGSHPGTQAQLDLLFQELHGDLLRGVPSIVCMHYDDQPDTTEHFRLILGYDADRDAVIYHEPAEANGSYRHMDRARFLSLWPLKSDERDWTVIRFRLEGEPTIPSESQPATARTAADYAQHIRALKEKLPAGFTIVLSPPFVVVGNDEEKNVEEYAERVVAWAVRLLKASYFERDPDTIIDVWLFKDDDSYRHYCKALFDEDPETPYGFYSADDHALLMNISTGGGTLVHEIVHPFMEANFPTAPPWLDEGLGSLYEQCDEQDGKIVGLVNWRLTGLQRDIRRLRLPTFKSLTAANRKAFYSGKHSNTGYGQSRYLLYYLQEKGKLGAFYHRFYKARHYDPTGYFTLQTILGESEMLDFQRRWEKWVMQLHYAGSE